MANTLKLFCNGAVGFIGWLDSDSPIFDVGSSYIVILAGDGGIHHATASGRLWHENLQSVFALPDGDETLISAGADDHVFKATAAQRD